MVLDVDPDVTTFDLMDRYSVPRDAVNLVVRNGVYIRPEERATAIFADGDTLAIWPPVAGG